MELKDLPKISGSIGATIDGFETYGGVEAISDRLMELKDLPKISGSIGATIDGFGRGFRAA